MTAPYQFAISKIRMAMNYRFSMGNVAAFNRQSLIANALSFANRKSIIAPEGSR
jgi:hypothetical protein